MDKQNPSPESQRLFGTLLASRPARSRSPLALTVAVLLHITLLVLLVAVSRPFMPKLAHKIFEPVTIILAEEEVPTIHLGMQTPAAAPKRAREEQRSDNNRAGEILTFTPGPVIGIPEAAPGPETAEPNENGTGGGGSLADRLRPRTIDPRLSGSSTYSLPPDASPAAAVRARVGATITAYNDSVAAESEARRRSMDWTIKTKDGKRWGINPDGTIQLGDIKLPQVALAPPAGRRDEIRARNRDFAEIERQANSEIGRQGFNQRVKAIRARKEKEREEKKKAAEAAPISVR